MLVVLVRVLVVFSMGVLLVLLYLVVMFEFGMVWNSIEGDLWWKLLCVVLVWMFRLIVLVIFSFMFGLMLWNWVFLIYGWYFRKYCELVKVFLVIV